MAVPAQLGLLWLIFLMLLMGMLGYGIYFGASHSVQQLAADAARTAMGGLSATERKQLATDYVSSNAASYAFLHPSELGVEVHDSPIDANQLVVFVSYEATNLPVWGLLRGMNMPPRIIRRHSTIRLGGR
ncbi:TadE/TadG family type IV pilus assembly protein [Aquamicrobium segne]|uniref:TadE/TadG family type IV pilus assembly protein n=1 Tax=Aquamicrobium segne TaxID=469547 RepID=A0ABW0GUX3_9HYPH